MWQQARIRGLILYHKATCKWLSAWKCLHETKTRKAELCCMERRLITEQTARQPSGLDGALMLQELENLTMWPSPWRKNIRNLIVVFHFICLQRQRMCVRRCTHSESSVAVNNSRAVKTLSDTRTRVQANVVTNKHFFFKSDSSSSHWHRLICLSLVWRYIYRIIHGLFLRLMDTVWILKHWALATC